MTAPDRYPHMAPATVAEPTPADRIRISADQRYDQIRSDGNLSDSARRALIGKAFLSAKQQMARLQARETGDAELARMTFMKAAFGAPSDPVAALSYRDACDRADQMTDPGAAMAAITRAIETGDKLMAQAIGQKAFDESAQAFGGGAWLDVLDRYAATSDAINNAISKMQKQRAGALADLTAVWQYLVPTPSEINGLSDNQVQTLVDQYNQVPSALDAVVPGSYLG